MHGKFRILKFTIIVYRVMGPCNMIVGYRGFGQDILSPCSDGLCRKTQTAPPKRFTPMYQTIRCPNPYCIMNPHHCEHLNPVPKNITNKWSIDGHVTLGKPNYRMGVLFFTDMIFNIMYFFPPTVHTMVHILLLKQTGEMRSEILPHFRHYHNIYTFQGQDHI